MDNLDDIDRAIINELQNNPQVDMENLKNTLNHNLGRKLSISTIYHRRNKLLESGVIKECFVPDYSKVGKETLCFIAVKFEGHDDNILDSFTHIPEIMEVHAVGGQYDVFLKVRGESIQDIANLVFKIRTEHHMVKTTEIFIVLRSHKETGNVWV